MEGFEGMSGFKRKKRSKDSAIYGVFAGDSSSDEEVKAKRSKDFSKPVAFTQGSTQAAETTVPFVNAAGEGRAGLGAGGAPGLGSGSYPGGPGLGSGALPGFGSGFRMAEQEQGGDEEEEEDDDDYRKMMPMSFLTKQENRKRRNQEEADARKKRSTESEAAMDPAVQEAAKSIDPARLAELQANAGRNSPDASTPCCPIVSIFSRLIANCGLFLGDREGLEGFRAEDAHEDGVQGRTGSFHATRVRWGCETDSLAADGCG